LTENASSWKYDKDDCDPFVVDSRRDRAQTPKSRKNQRQEFTMRSAKKARGVLAIVLAVVLAAALSASPGAGASPAREGAVDRVEQAQPSSHCGGYVASTSNYDTETVTSFWVFNLSLVFPPTCRQIAVAICSAVGPVGGDPTINPGEVSSVTCPFDQELLGSYVDVAHV
jgi:hypothetical protein